MRKLFQLLGLFIASLCAVVLGNSCSEEASDPTTVTYTVTFDTDGGTSIASQTVEEGECATQPSDPTKENYTFAGWYENAACTTEWSFSTPITSDTTIYAKWETEAPVQTYTVTFDTDGGSSVASQTVEQGGLVTKPSNPTKENYTFAAWYTDTTYVAEWDFDTRTITENTTIYATWVNTDSELTDMETGTIW